MVQISETASVSHKFQNDRSCFIDLDQLSPDLIYEHFILKISWSSKIKYNKNKICLQLKKII